MVVYYKTPRNLWTAIFSQYFDLLDFFFLAPRVPNVVANMNEKLGEEKQDCKKGLRGKRSNDIIQVLATKYNSNQLITDQCFWYTDKYIFLHTMQRCIGTMRVPEGDLHCQCILSIFPTGAHQDLPRIFALIMQHTYFKVYSLIIGNLVDEIILLLPDSNTGSLNNKANTLSADPAKKHPPNSFIFLSKSWISGR